jgi:hypothetical protein
MVTAGVWSNVTCCDDDDHPRCRERRPALH